MRRALIALLAAFGTVGQAMAQEVLYCTDETMIGFDADKDGIYQRAQFESERFTMAVDKAKLTLTTNGDIGKRVYDCKENPVDRSFYVCSTMQGATINFNTKSNMYTRFRGFGYAFGTTDSVTVSIGSCGNF